MIDIKESFDQPNNKSTNGKDKTNQGMSSRTKYISIYWKCCHIFSRIYQNKNGTAYQGCCPRCLKSVEAPIGPQGTSQRMFMAG
ncbi:MAG: hypothetical protein K0S74_404 [Chlamydiales bacterium]|jgi:hypothetical protein|nr:hypothetical protein [Chlamydiales bacterium]